MTAQYDQIAGFLKELDSRLSFKKPLSLYLIGGAAITLAYDQRNRTSDLDLICPSREIIEKGGRKSPLARKYQVYVSPLEEINFSAPDDWKEKCQSLNLGLSHLTLFVPCVEDIVLGKVARLEPRDFEDILLLYESKKLDPKRLLVRLRDNKKELRDMRYRNNTLLLFRDVFGYKLVFRRGDIKIYSST